MNSIVLLVLLTLASPVSIANDVEFEYLGAWEGLSKVLYSVYGDMEITKEKVVFNYTGSYDYTVESASTDRVLIKLSKVMDCGQYIELKPSGSKLEFSVFNNIDSEYCAWGFYQRKI
jgi:hypothetical protein